MIVFPDSEILLLLRTPVSQKHLTQRGCPSSQKNPIYNLLF